MKTESTINPNAITIERDKGIVHVVLSENITSKMKDDTTMYEYDMTRVVTDDAGYDAGKKRTIAQWKPYAKDVEYADCVMTDNGLYPVKQVVDGKRVQLDELQTNELIATVAWSKSDIDIPVEEEAIVEKVVSK